MSAAPPKAGKKPKRDKRAQWLLEYLIAGAVYYLLRLLPLSAALGLGGVIGVLAYRFGRRHSRITEGNLGNSFPEKSPGEIRAIARAVYRNLGRSAVEFILSERILRRPVEERFEFVNYDAFVRALEKGRGVLLLTGHCGSWEMMALAQSVLKPTLHVVVRPLDNPYLERAVTRIRTRYGNTLINKRRGMREILKALEKGGSIGILLDQSVTRKEGVFVDFFGRPACTNKGLALLAAKTKAPVIPGFTRRVGLCRHEIILGDEVPLVETGDKEADLAANTQAYTRVIEDFVRKYPDQWFWMHRRWKTKLEDV